MSGIVATRPWPEQRRGLELSRNHGPVLTEHAAFFVGLLPRRGVEAGWAHPGNLDGADQHGMDASRLRRWRRPEDASAQRFIYLRGSLPVLVVDIDEVHHEHAWCDAGLPEPTWVVTNPESGHCQMAWALRFPVQNTNGRQKKILDELRSKFTLRLGGDPAYRGWAFRSPGFAHHLVRWGPMVRYCFKELGEFVRGDRLQGHTHVADGRAALPVAAVPGQRNTTLFGAVVQHARRRGGRAALSELERVADELNACFLPPLPPSEVVSVARSVCRYESAGRIRPSRSGNRGRDGHPVPERHGVQTEEGWRCVGELLPQEEVYRRRAEAGRKTGGLRAVATRKRVLEAYLASPGATITDLVDSVGMAWATVRKHLDQILADQQAQREAASGSSRCAATDGSAPTPLPAVLRVLAWRPHRVVHRQVVGHALKGAATRRLSWRRRPRTQPRHGGDP